MYFWLAGTLAAALYEEGRDWDAHEVLMQEAFESATLRGDRARLLTLGTLYATARGEDLEERPKRVRELIGETTDPDELVPDRDVREQQRAAHGRTGARVRQRH